jgi:glyoxylase-like metal-dependent hydrolase (beta-lactamase superfamily II)
MKKGTFLALLFSVIAAISFASESDGIFTFNVGRLEVSMMVERQNPGNANILPGADPALLSRYIPAGGFTHSTNTFLIKAPGMNIIVDTGFGGEIFTKLEQLGVRPDQIDAVLITHLHGDHIGGLQKDGKALFPRAKIYLSSRELEYFTKTNVNQGAAAALAPYGSAVEAFDPPALGMVRREILPGISAIAAYGHTPGHTIYMAESGGARLLLIGDLLHVALVQFPRPDISASYDMDQRAAAETRSNVLGYAARNRIPVGGIHMVYPGVGSVETDGSGFRFVPAN